MGYKDVVSAYCVRKRDESGLCIGIHKVIARGLEPEKKEEEEYTPIYPCPVINRYECPFEREGRPNVTDLFAIYCNCSRGRHGFS